MKKIGILSDTHGYTHPKLFEFFKDCDEIWHAGDMMSSDILVELETVAKVRAVYGNCDDWDIRGKCKEVEVFECEGHKVFLKHIVGKPGRYYSEALSEIKKVNPSIVIAGHSHILQVQHDDKNGFLFINPGAAGRFGIHTRLTFLRFRVEDKVLSKLEIFDECK